MKFIIIILSLFLINCATQKPQLKINETIIESYQFSFEKKHHLKNDVAKQKAEDLANSLKKHGLIWKWISPKDIYFNVDTGLLSGSNGILTVLPAEIKLNIKGIPEPLLLFRGIIIDKVNSRLEYYFPN